MFINFHMSFEQMRATTPRRLALYLTEGEELRRRLAAWLISGLRKGVPSLFKVRPDSTAVSILMQR